MSQTDDLYEILHLHPSAHPDVIQAAYRRLALLYHPDRNSSPEASEMMAAVNRAYEVLSDPEKRAEYDRSRAAQTTSTEASNPSGASASQASRGPSNAPRNPTGYFGLGSTKSDVADIHGPPRDVSIDRDIREEVWHYGGTDVIRFGLDSEKVQGWSNIRGNLRICLLPGPNVTSYDFFTIGSHRDEVCRLHGTPPQLITREKDDWECWLYSEIIPIINHVEFSFSTGRVTGWENNDGSLKARRSGSTPGSGTSSRAAGNWKTLSNEYNDVGIYTVDPIDSDYRLIVRFRNRELQLYVLWGTKISHLPTATVDYLIDDGSGWSHSWGVSTDSVATYLPTEDVLETILALLDASRIIVQVYPFVGGPILASFRVHGFREAVAPVLAAWRRTGSPAPGHTAQPGCLPFLLPVGALGVAAVVIPAIWFLL